MQSSIIPEELIQQLVFMGFTRNLSIQALDFCGNNIEASIDYCLENAAEVEQIQTMRSIAASEEKFHLRKSYGMH